MNIKIEKLGYISDSALKDIIKKIKVITKNIDLFIDNSSNDCTIILDGATADDEFYIQVNENIVKYIEVTDKFWAVRNDMDFLNKEQKKDYRLGKINSMYKKFDNSKFYYREL